MAATQRAPLRLWPLAIVPREDLVGRQDTVERIAAELTTGRSVILAAPRRLGKTSVAQEVLRLLGAEGWITVHVDFLQFTSPLEIADELSGQLIGQSRSLARRLGTLARTAGRAATLVKPHWQIAGAEFGIDLANKRDEQQALQKALQLPQQLADREGRQVVLFFDEFQEAAGTLGSRIYGIMRSYFQRQADVHQIFAGSRAGLLRQLFTKPNAPLLRYATEIPFPSLIPVEAWVPYIVRKFRAAKLACGRGIAEMLVEQTGGHPADTMEVCQQLYLLTLASQQSVVDADLLTASLDQARTNLRAVFDELWAELRSPAYTRLVAARIARGESPTAGAARQGSEGVPVKLLVTGLKALVDRGITVHSPQGGYTFVEPLLERYVRERG